MAGSDQISEPSARQDEALSALFDGEGSELELRRLLAAQDPQQEAKWQRFAIAQAVLRGQGGEMRQLSPDFSQAVMSALPNLAGEAAVKSKAGTWTTGVAKLAIAASVAVACVFALQLALPSSTTPTTAGSLMLSSSVQDPGNDIAIKRLDEQERGGLNSQEPFDAVAATAGTANVAAQPVDALAQQRLQEYIANMAVLEDQPVRTEHLQESPLYRLVSETVELPLKR